MLSSPATAKTLQHNLINSAPFSKMDLSSDSVREGGGTFVCGAKSKWQLRQRGQQDNQNKRGVMFSISSASFFSQGSWP